MNKIIKLSIIIPIYNEQNGIRDLFSRLDSILNSLKERFEYEILFVNDGSIDGSQKILDEIYSEHRETVRVIECGKNYGQHNAIIIGMQHSKGDIVITMDADLQNPPEEIPKLVDKMQEGFDLVSGYRAGRNDSIFRRIPSRVANAIREKTTKIVMKDQGCMLRAYSRELIERMINAKEYVVYIPALAYSCSIRSAEIEVAHEQRKTGKSKYSLYGLMRLNFDIMTGYSMVPLQMFTLFGFGLSICSILFFLILIIRRILIGPEVQGLFTLFAIMFFVMGILSIGFGITGEYIGRIYQEIRHSKRNFIIKKILE